MRSSSLAVAGIALAASTQAQTVQFDIAKRHDIGLRRRAASPFDVPIQNLRSQGGYFVSVSVGTPAQKLSLQLDTGSSDVWVPYSQADICVDTSQQNPGCTQGSFDPDKSSTFKDVQPGEFDISYVDNSGSKGDYVTDNFQIGSVTVQNLTMGLGLKSTIAFGLIGVGYRTNEASLGTTRTTYPNLPVTLQAQGDINTIAYSLWLNDLESNSGSILFGGIDTEKYQGDLTKLDIVSPNGKTFTEFAVQVYSVEASSPSGTDNLPTSEQNLVAVLDSGTTLSYLPQDMAEEAWNEVGAVYNNDIGLAVIPCSSKNSPGLFSFRFGGPSGPRINVTMDELVLDLSSGGPAPQFTSGPNRGQSVCEFGIQNQTQAPYLLGDSFLRSAYVVYDLVNNQVAIAATDFNATKTNVVAFPSNGASIPSATALASQAGSPSSPTQSGLSAQTGFSSSNGKNSDNAAHTVGALSGPGLLVIGMTLAYTLLGSAIFGIGCL